MKINLGKCEQCDTNDVEAVYKEEVIEYSLEYPNGLGIKIKEHLCRECLDSLHPKNVMRRS